MKTVCVALSMLLVSSLAYAAVVPDFQGHYERYNNDQLDTDTAFIDLTKVGSNTYELSGTSVWVGDSSSGLVNFGEIDGVVTLKGNQIDYDVDGCTLQILFEQDTLIVSKDNGCGGLNVTFNGTYVRTPESQ
ncbi:hypothetical protein ACSVUS_004715 [Vibrio alginolyticus]|uniref:hypothetical protein n=1 Tax=Vibrio TaxID=662 RepID=UPI0015588805|nr:MULTISPECIES: hypothetical protein [Vibrio]EGQ9765628.1 hypothetical protein [Vibrio alginolyticus]EHA1101029.1 hypothetical protein [Vibrio alginolyticus]EHA1123260.1 hypothetical protein [Vibrio alginolyticus]EIE5867940.1 hypothetical protein [Vibrio alginolyticus]EJG1640860.1 hypothetical protein [Vibrio alginolyticus]